MNLTDEQLAAVTAPDGAYLVVAPPGSGKTEVLIRRVLHLVTDAPQEPFRVLALTYTNRAARQLDDRARATLGEEAWRVTATTLHGFCLDMLQRYGEVVGVVGEVSVLDTDDLRLDLLAHALEAAGYAAPEPGSQALRDLLASIDDLRLDLVPPDLAPGTALLSGDLELAEAYRIYEDALDDARTLDFPGMLFRAWRLLTEDPWVGSHYRRQYRHLLVDEAQDLTSTQAQLISALCGDDLRNVFLVADDDQEIFTFAGASCRHYTELADQLNAAPLVLSTNFRSARQIVEAAERLRSHVRTLRVKRPPATPATAAEGWIEARALHDRASEGVAVADWIAELLADGLPASWLHEGEDRALRPQDVCVMARTRYGFDGIVDALERAEIAYVLRTGEAGLFDSRRGRALYFTLRVLANPRDHASQRRLEELLAASTTAAELPATYAGSAGEDSVTGAPTAALAADRFELPEEIAQILPGNDDAAFDPAAFDGLVVDDEPEAELWAADRARLLEYWDRYAARTRVPERTLPGFLREISRLQRTPPDEPGVRLLTPYRAKGLQFRAVVITGMSDGMFPYYRATTEREIDEERRAVYVAVTRAARAVLLTRPRQRADRFERIHRDPPSPFLEELGLPAS